MTDSRKTPAGMIADWLREASVLVAVFGVLDSFARKEPFYGPWNLTAIVLAVVFFVLGATLERVRPLE